MMKNRAVLWEYQSLFGSKVNSEKEELKIFLAKKLACVE